MTAKVFFKKISVLFTGSFKTAPCKTKGQNNDETYNTIFFWKNKIKQTKPRLPSTTITKKYYYEFKFFF